MDNPNVAITLAVLAAFVAVGVYGYWRADQPADPLRPRMLPWRLVAILCAAVSLYAISYLLKLLGVDMTAAQRRLPY